MKWILEVAASGQCLKGLTRCSLRTAGHAGLKTMYSRNLVGLSILSSSRWCCFQYLGGGKHPSSCLTALDIRDDFLEQHKLEYNCICLISIYFTVYHNFSGIAVAYRTY